MTRELIVRPLVRRTSGRHRAREFVLAGLYQRQPPATHLTRSAHKSRKLPGSPMLTARISANCGLALPGVRRAVALCAPLLTGARQICRRSNAVLAIGAWEMKHRPAFRTAS